MKLEHGLRKAEKTDRKIERKHFRELQKLWLNNGGNARHYWILKNDPA